MSRARLSRWARLAVCLTGFAAAAMVPGDSRALAPGAIVLWFDDITNTANPTANVCIVTSNDSNGAGNGNAGQGGGSGICF